MAKIEEVLDRLASPARRAILSAGINTLEDLSTRSEKEIAAFHGIGENALETIREILKEYDLSLQE